MTTLRDTARQIGSAWTPAHTTAVIVLAALAIGFLPFVKMGLVVNGIFLGAIIALEVWPESHWLGFALRQPDVLQSYTTC